MITTDSIKSLINGLKNKRKTTSANIAQSESVLDFETCYALWQSAIGRKVVNIKSQYPLNNTIQFESEEQEKFYKRNLEQYIRRAGQYMLAYGRGVVVVVSKDDPLNSPLMKSSKSKKMLRVFSKQVVSVSDVDKDWYSDRFMQPKSYFVNGEEVHHSRVIDFSYIRLPDQKQAEAQYGGVSEFQFIYQQLINDNVVSDSSASILEKSANMFYKIKDFKRLSMNKQAGDIIDYIGAMEDVRGIYGAGIVDAEDDVINVSQSISNIQEADTISLRRIALGTSIPMAWLVGESAGGLNSTGKIESEAYQSMIEEMQQSYYLTNINKLMRIFNSNDIEFKDNQAISPEEKIKYETQAINNAQVLWSIGQDENKYLKHHDIDSSSEDIDYSSMFQEENELNNESN